MEIDYIVVNGIPHEVHSFNGLIETIADDGTRQFHDKNGNLGMEITISGDIIVPNGDLSWENGGAPVITINNSSQ